MTLKSPLPLAQFPPHAGDASKVPTQFEVMNRFDSVVSFVVWAACFAAPILGLKSSCQRSQYVDGQIDLIHLGGVHRVVMGSRSHAEALRPLPVSLALVSRCWEPLCRLGFFSRHRMRPRVTETESSGLLFSGEFGWRFDDRPERVAVFPG